MKMQGFEIRTMGDEGTEPPRGSDGVAGGGAMGQLVRPEPADGPFEIPTLEDSIAGTVRFLQWVVRMVAGGQLEPNTGRSPTYACTALLTGLKVRNMERKLEELQELLRQSGIQPPKVG